MEKHPMMYETEEHQRLDDATSDLMKVLTPALESSMIALEVFEKLDAWFDAKLAVALKGLTK